MKKLVYILCGLAVVPMGAMERERVTIPKEFPGEMRAEVATKKLTYLLNSYADEVGSIPLKYAQEADYLMAFAKIAQPALLLIQAGADRNVQNYNGNTLLHLAVNYNKWEIAENLLSRNADPNIQNNKGDTPLHELAKKARNAIINMEITENARYRQYLETMMRALIDKDAKRDIKNNAGLTPYDIVSAEDTSTRSQQANAYKQSVLLILRPNLQ